MIFHSLPRTTGSGKMFEKLDLLPPEEAFDGPMQMALDEVILSNVAHPTLRVYEWEVPCVTFGYFQKFSDVRSLYPYLPLVRRWTGGGIVEHGRDLTFSLMIPKENAAASLPPAIFYKKVHALLATLLAEASGCEIRLAGKEDVLVGTSCFQAPAGDDLMMLGRKILGGALRRSGGSLLYQGSLQGMDISPRHERLAGVLSQEVSCASLPRVISDGAVALARSRYRTEEWNRKW
jgi:lipoate-protein ligase A